MIVEFVGPSGSGKSRLARMATAHLTDSGMECHYHRALSRLECPECEDIQLHPRRAQALLAATHPQLAAELLRARIKASGRSRSWWSRVAARTYAALSTQQTGIVLLDEGPWHGAFIAGVASTLKSSGPSPRLLRCMWLPDMFVVVDAPDSDRARVRRGASSVAGAKYRSGMEAVILLSGVPAVRLYPRQQSLGGALEVLLDGLGHWPPAGR